jgi:PAS domain S-box-containing protein
MRAGAKDFIRKDHLERLLPAIDRELEEAARRRRHRAAEQALRESEERFSQISGLTGELIWEVDAQGLYTYLSPACATLLGYREAEVVGRLHFYDLHPEEGREAFRQAAFDVFRQKGLFKDLHNPVHTKDGRILEVITNGMPILAPDGSLRGYRGSDQDITEKMQSERILARLATAVEQAGDMLIMTDAEGRIEYVNPAFEQATGFTQAEALGNHPGHLLRHREKSAPQPELWTALRDKGLWRGRFTNRHKNGQMLLHEASISAIRGASGEILGYVSSQRDVTGRVELETHLAQASRIEAIGTLAGGIAHDFNNILTAIRGFTELALLKTSLESDLRRPLEGILQASTRAKDLIHQIQAFCQEKGHVSEPVVVGHILKEALRFIRATVPSTLAIHCEASSTSQVLADPTDIHRIIVNLCTNAVLAMPGGGGRLDVRLDEVALDGPAAQRLGIQAGPYVHLAIEDTGCGMTPDVAARIFEPYFTTRQDRGGTGMGLSVVHGILKALGGGITVESRPGLGTTFEVLLPIASGLTQAEGARHDQLQQGTGRILFVDDEAVLCEMAQEMLQHMGYEVETRTAPDEALACFQRDPRRFDAVITDLTMPGMSGDLLAARLVALRPDLPVILCTGFEARLDARRASSRGVTRVMMKPFSWAEMSAVLREALQPACRR